LDLVDDEDIELGVIDLDDLQRILGMILSSAPAGSDRRLPSLLPDPAAEPSG
jgi:hypothetical protein